MDKTAFFREATLRICGNLEIEKALFSTLIFLQQEMPVSRMALEYYDKSVEKMRTIARANQKGGKSVNLITPFSADDSKQAEKKYDQENQEVFLFIDPKKEKLAQEMLTFHGVDASSLMVLSLKSGDTMIGTLALLTEGEAKFTQQHADLASLLSEPFAVALLNTLKHRNELKLQERDLFWEVTSRICGNLDIEKGLGDCFKYLSQCMPADTLYLQRYEQDLGSMRYIARADTKKGEAMDLLIALPSEINTLVLDLEKAHSLGQTPPVLLFNAPQENPLSKFILEAIGEPFSSAMSLQLWLDGQRVGGLLLVAKGDNRFNEHHAKLYANLQAPFTIAMSNMLKHREILKLKDLLADDNRFLHNELHRLSGDKVIGTNFGLRDVMFKVRQVSSIETPVLLLGETGVGKDVIANTIHYSSSRSSGPFVSINCGAIPDSLIDSELFGHEKGAFTGALSQKRGRFERANRGTIFLDEIGELPAAAQVRLLRVLQSREIDRVGGVKTISLDIRVIAATNRNLKEMVKNRKFREDLWFRLNVFPIIVPPLRHRRSDIPSLVKHFIDRKAKELKIAATPTLAGGAIDSLMAYDWPGNVRELENVIERAMILHRGKPLRFDDLGLSSVKPDKSAKGVPTEETLELDALIKDHIQRVLQLTGGKIHGPGGAGEVLGVNPGTLRSRMKKLGINFGKRKI